MYYDFEDQEETVAGLIYEFPQIFREICEILNFTCSENIENYSDQDIKDIFITLKHEHRNTWKEL